jgi:hypothetical protein
VAPGKEEGAGAHQKGGSIVRQRKRRQAVAFNASETTSVVTDECDEVLQLKGDKGVRRGRLIEKNRGSGRRSPMKADGGVIRTKSHAGRSPPVIGGGQEVWGCQASSLRPGKRREEGGKEGGAAVATAAVLNRHAEVGDGRWGGAMWQARAKGEGARERGS